jgi:hypothetical protein
MNDRPAATFRREFSRGQTRDPNAARRPSHPRRPPIPPARPRRIRPPPRGPESAIRAPPAAHLFECPGGFATS